VVALSMNFFEF